MFFALSFVFFDALVCHIFGWKTAAYLESNFGSRGECGMAWGWCLFTARRINCIFSSTVYSFWMKQIQTQWVIVRIRKEIEECRSCNTDVHSSLFRLQNLLSVKVKHLSRWIQCCCRSFNVPLLCFVHFTKKILAMAIWKDHDHVNIYYSVKNKFYGYHTNWKIFNWQVILTSWTTITGCGLI